MFFLIFPCNSSCSLLVCMEFFSLFNEILTYQKKTSKQKILKQWFKNALLLAPSVICSPQASTSQEFYLHSRQISSAANYNVHWVALSMSAAITNKTLETQYIIHIGYISISLSSLHNVYVIGKHKTRKTINRCVYLFCSYLRQGNYICLMNKCRHACNKKFALFP